MSNERSDGSAWFDLDEATRRRELHILVFDNQRQGVGFFMRRLYELATDNTLAAWLSDPARGRYLVQLPRAGASVKEWIRFVQTDYEVCELLAQACAEAAFFRHLPRPQIHSWVLPDLTGKLEQLVSIFRAYEGEVDRLTTPTETFHNPLEGAARE